MENSSKKGQKSGVILSVATILVCVLLLVYGLFSPQLLTDKTQNFWLNAIIQQTLGIIAVILLMLRLNVRLFAKPQKLWVLLPCLLVAVDNFQFYSYFSGNMSFARTSFWDITLYTLYNVTTGVFEEGVFRGIIFALLASRFGENKKGLIKTFVLSSVIFALSHLFNLVQGADVGATLLQVGYTLLTGGLFAFIVIQTHNVLLAGLIHGIYNACGQLMDNRVGLGTGVVFDAGTAVIMAIVGVSAAVYVLYSLYKLKDSDITLLYQKLGVSSNNPKQTSQTSQNNATNQAK